MSIFIEGLLSGLLLACSLGPIFIALTQTSLEKGIKPGMTVGSGIWFSDILIVFLMYKFLNTIQSTIESPSFNFWMGLSGAIILIIFGAVLLIKKPQLKYEDIKIKNSDYFGFWLKGFLVNTVNPFTFIFWMGIISTYMIGRKVSDAQILILLTTIIAVIIISDMGKVFLANGLKKFLTPIHIHKIATLSGIILIGFGLFLGYKTY